MAGGTPITHHSTPHEQFIKVFVCYFHPPPRFSSFLKRTLKQISDCIFIWPLLLQSVFLKLLTLFFHKQNPLSQPNPTLAMTTPEDLILISKIIFPGLSQRCLVYSWVWSKIQSRSTHSFDSDSRVPLSPPATFYLHSNDLLRKPRQQS